MVDFSGVNLCGANADFNKLMSQVDNIKKTLLGNIEAEAADIVAELGVDLNVLGVDLRVLVAKLATIKPANLQAEITSLLAMSPVSAPYISKLADITGKFGVSLSANGYDLDSLIQGASSDLLSGLDLCANIPNFELPANATDAVEKAKAALQPTTVPEKEIKSVAKVELNSAVSEAKTAAAAKVASYAAAPSEEEGKVSGAFKTSSKTEKVTYPSGTVETVTHKNAVSSTVETRTAENKSGAISVTSTSKETSTTRTTINESGVEEEVLDEAAPTNAVTKQEIKTSRSNYVSALKEAGFADRTVIMIEEFYSSSFLLSHTPVNITTIWAYSPNHPPPPSRFAGKFGKFVPARWTTPFGTPEPFEEDAADFGVKGNWYYQSLGEYVEIVDSNGFDIEDITKVKICYKYHSNYDPRWDVEEGT